MASGLWKTAEEGDKLSNGGRGEVQGCDRQKTWDETRIEVWDIKTRSPWCAKEVKITCSWTWWHFYITCTSTVKHVYSYSCRDTIHVRPWLYLWQCGPQFVYISSIFHSISTPKQHTKQSHYTTHNTRSTVAQFWVHKKLQSIIRWTWHLCFS